MIFVGFERTRRLSFLWALCHTGSRLLLLRVVDTHDVFLQTIIPPIVLGVRVVARGVFGLAFCADDEQNVSQSRVKRSYAND